MALFGRSEAPATPAATATDTLVGESCIMEGRLTVTGAVHMAGKFNGQLTSSAEVTITSSARVTAEISVSSLVVQGDEVLISHRPPKA